MMISHEQQHAPPAESPSVPPARAVWLAPAAWRALLVRLTLGSTRPLLRLLALGLFFAFWHLASTYQLTWYIRFVNIPTPGGVLREMLRLLCSKMFSTHIVTSLQRVCLPLLL